MLTGAGKIKGSLIPVASGPEDIHKGQGKHLQLFFHGYAGPQVPKSGVFGTLGLSALCPLRSP